MKNAKQKSTAIQNRIDGLIDVYVSGKFVLTCKQEDLTTIQVKYLIDISNGTIQQKRRKTPAQKK